MFALRGVQLELNALLTSKLDFREQSAHVLIDALTLVKKRIGGTQNLSVLGRKLLGMPGPAGVEVWYPTYKKSL